MIYTFSMIAIFFTSIVNALIQITPGGIIVPLYLSLYIKEPERLIGTLSVSFMTLLIYRIISSFFLIEKKKTLIIMVLISTILTYIWWKFMPVVFPTDFLFKTAGWIIPGILANTMNRQGIIKTIISCISCTLILFILYVLIFFK
jgi:poly-gamma-glutamate biosynthesis protein PgsC/CapC